MSLPAPYTFFDAEPTTPPRAFPQFTRLPVELRCLIWKLAISAPRLIRIEVVDDDAHPDPDSQWHIYYKSTNELGNIVSSYPYYVNILPSSEPACASICGVCHESQEIFHQIYRIRMPIKVDVLGIDAEGTRYLHISPQTNIIWLQTCFVFQTNLTMLSFLHDIMAYDPRGIGITQLGLHNDIYHPLEDLEADGLPLPLQTSLTKMFSTSLETFYSIIKFDVGAHVAVSRVKSTKALVPHYHPIPVLPNTQMYRRLESDPRDIQQYLQDFQIVNGIQKYPYIFNRFKASCKVTRDIPMRYVLFCELDPNTDMSSRNTFVKVIQDKYEECCYLIEDPSYEKSHSQVPVVETEPVTAPLVAGMWNIPAEAFGEIRSTDLDWNYLDPEHIKLRGVDLSKHPPELWVFNLT